jgi:sarcosine oxidase subunit beta
MTRERIDHLVIGAGVVGMSVAWQLAKTGAECVVVDARGVGSGATSVQPGGVRTQWTSESMCRLALESRAFYLGIEDNLAPRRNPSFDPCGYVFAASSATTLAELEQRVKRQNSLGVTSEILTADQLADLVPGLDPEHVTGAAYNAGDGYFDHPGAVVTAFADAAERNGAEIRIVAVEGLRREPGGWEVVFKSGDTLIADRVVIAAGAETARLADTAGYDLPITPEPRYLFFSNPIRPFLVRPLVVFQDEHFAIKHLADGSVLASDMRHGAASQADETRWRREVTEKTRILLPLLEYVRYPVMAEGFYDVTPDAQLIVGPVPGLPGLTVAAGMNGRGMMLAPAIGQMVAESVLTGAAAIPAELLPSRFADGRTRTRESQVI